MGEQTLQAGAITAWEERQANNSTIELVHGGTLHVKHTADEVAQKIAKARQDAVVWIPVFDRVSGDLVERPFPSVPPLIEVERMEGHTARRARGFNTVRLNIEHIVGVFPLISGSERVS